MTDDIDAYITDEDVLGHPADMIYATIINGKASTTIIVDSIEYTHSLDKVHVKLEGWIPAGVLGMARPLAYAGKNARVTVRKDTTTRDDTVLMED